MRAPGIKSPFRSLLRGFGNIIHNGLHCILNLARRGSNYETINLQANYAPWKKDALFLQTFKAIRSNTFVDKYRCYELWTLVEQSKKLEGALIEIGVWRGGTGALIAKQALRCGIKDRVYLCDTFRGIVKVSDQDSTYKGGEHADTSRGIVEQLVATLGLDNVTILEGIFPDQTAQLIEEERFRFCHIDVDVYDSAKGIVEWVWDKMVVGGIIVYDDYGFEACDGITKYVEEQIACPDRLVMHNLNGHALIVKMK
jgi:O-methyltransferase